MNRLTWLFLTGAMILASCAPASNPTPTASQPRLPQPHYRSGPYRGPYAYSCGACRAPGWYHHGVDPWQPAGLCPRR